MVCSICMEKIKTWNEKKIEMARNRPVFDFLLKQVCRKFVVKYCNVKEIVKHCKYTTILLLLKHIFNYLIYRKYFVHWIISYRFFHYGCCFILFIYIFPNQKNFFNNLNWSRNFFLGLNVLIVNCINYTQIKYFNKGYYKYF